MAKLYPPIIEGTLPAFYGNQIEVPFTMNRAVGENDYSAISIAIKNVVSGSVIETVPVDKNVVENNIAKGTLTKEYAVGQYYKIQLAYKDRSEQPVTGYYSTVGIAKYTATPTEPTIECDVSGRCIGTYTIPEKDKLEKLYSYEFNLKDKEGNLKASSGVQLHDTNSDSGDGTQSDFWTLPMTPEAGDQLTYSIKTMNGIEKTAELPPAELPVPVGNTVDHDLRALLSAEMDNDSGSVVLRIKPRPVNVYNPLLVVDDDKNPVMVTDKLTGSFVLLRKTNINNSWQEIERFNLVNQPLPVDLWIDYTLEAGVEYIYALQFYNKNKVYSTPILNYEGPQVADFYDAFLYDGERQLRICYNPRVSSFKTVKMESKVNTIGGNYPFIFRNGDTNYKEFSIGGLLSFNGDEQYKFRHGAKIGVARPDTRTRSRTEAIDNIENSNTTNLTSENFKLEREFKLQVLDWLNNGKPKLFRSPGEGNYIVQLMNTSLTPTDSLGRMIHSFNTSATEIMDYTWNNLNDLGYMELNIESNNGHALDSAQNPLGSLTSNMKYYNDTNPQAYPSTVNNITENIINPSNQLATANITSIALTPMPLYIIKYRYEQMIVEGEVNLETGKREVFWTIRRICTTTEAEQHLKQKDIGIYYIYNKCDGFNDINNQSTQPSYKNKLSPQELQTKLSDSFYNLRDETIYQNNSVTTNEQAITPIDYNYQINMTKYPSLKYRTKENTHIVEPLVEDIYAIHIGNGLRAVITYEPSLVDYGPKGD